MAREPGAVALPSITVVVPAFQAEALIGACIDALAEQVGLDEPFELVVVDDGSRDGTALAAQLGLARHPGAAWSDARVLHTDHRGVAAARNAGAAAARGEILAFTDADCRPEPDWLRRLTAPLADPAVGAAMGRFKSDQRALVARLTQAEYAAKEQALLAHGRIAFFDTATGAVRRSVFEAVGGFDPALLAVEDTELAFRLAAAGHRIVMVPDAYVRHRHAETWWHYLRRKARIGRWGARVYPAFPARVSDDTRTSWAMRLQLVLAPAIVLLAVLAGAGRVPWWLPAGLGVLLTASAAGEASRALAADRDVLVALAMPVAAFARACGLASGLAFGMVEGLVRRTGRAVAARRLGRRRTA